MKNILFLFVFACFSLFFAQRSDAQCYVRLEDASGFNTDAYQDTLQAAAAKLCAIFDSTGFAGQFKVYDFGFYLHQENTTGGYPEPFVQKMAAVQDSSPYYLLFGKQTDKSGVYTKVWVHLMLPDTGEFGCKNDLQRQLYMQRVQKKVNDQYQLDSKSLFLYFSAEIAGITELSKIALDIVECCYVDGNRNMSDCTGCGIEMVDTYFTNLAFQKYQASSKGASPIEFENEYIKEVSNIKVYSQDTLNYISNHISNLINQINQDLDFNLLITSDSVICDGPLDQYENYNSQKEFGAWINLGNYGALDSSNFHINVVWNENKKHAAQNRIIADIIVSQLTCQILSFLEITNSVCLEFQSPPPSIQYPFCDNEADYNDNPHDIYWLIQRIIDEENKIFPESKRRNTKLMFTTLRKIFYNTPAWNEIIIPATENIASPYDTVIVAYPDFPKIWRNPDIYVKHKLNIGNDFFYFQDIEARPIDAAGQSPSMYCDNPSCNNWNQEVLINSCGSQVMVDIGHVLTGIDALNNPTYVGYQYGVFDLSVSTNAGVATWIGDIGSVITAWQHKYDNKSCELGVMTLPTDLEMQEIVNKFSSGADMLGNIDSYVIFAKYNTKAENNGALVSEILTDYYLGAGQLSYQSNRYSTFAAQIGLIWNGQEFSNLKDKMPLFIKDVKGFAVLFTAASVKNYYGSLFKTIIADWAIYKLWGSTDHQINQHLTVFFEGLKQQLVNE